MGRVARMKADVQIRALLQTANDTLEHALRYRKVALEALRLLSEGQAAVTDEEKAVCRERLAAIEAEAPVLESWRVRIETMQKNYR